MIQSQHRDDISDKSWEQLEPHLLGRKGTWGGNAKDNRKFINGVIYLLITVTGTMFTVALSGGEIKVYGS